MTLADLMRRGVPPLERTRSCTPSSSSQSINTGSPSSSATVREGKKVRLRGEWRVHDVELSPPKTVTDPAQHDAISLAVLRGTSARHLTFGNEATLQNKFNIVLVDLLGVINVRDVVRLSRSVRDHQEVIPDVTVFDRRTGEPVLSTEYKVPATDRGTHAHSKPDVATQLHLQCDRQYFSGIEHPCVVLLDGATMSVAWRDRDNDYFQNLIGATSEEKRCHWPESFRHTLSHHQGGRRVHNPKRVTPPRRNGGLRTPIYGTSAATTAAVTHLTPSPSSMPTDTGVLTHGDAREAHEAGVAIQVVMHRTLVYRVTTVTGDGHGSAATATATGGQRVAATTQGGGGGGGGGGQSTAEDLASIVDGESKQQQVLNACSLLELALATGARRRLHNEIKVGAPSDLFVECYRPTSSEPTYQHWPAVNATYGIPGRCQNFARLRYLGEGADGEVGLYSTVPDNKSLSCRVFVAKSYKYHTPRPEQQEAWAGWAEARTAHMWAQANKELDMAHKVYCGEDALFDRDFFDVKVIKGQPMFCQPYFEPIPKVEREAALEELPELLKRFTNQGRGYSFKDNEVHWRHLLKYKHGDVTKYVLVDFCRLEELQSIIGGLPEGRLRGVDRNKLTAAERAAVYVDLHVGTLRQRMKAAAAGEGSVTDAVAQLTLGGNGGGGD